MTNKTKIEQVRDAQGFLEDMVFDIQAEHETSIKEVFNNMPVNKLLYTIKQALQEKLERLENGGWLTIESAPHEEIILMWSSQFGYEAAMFSQGETLSNGYSNYSEHSWATHWQPLPQAPKQGDK